MDEGLLSLKWNNHKSSFLHILSSLRHRDSYADVTLACDGKFYPSHKLVLSTCSEYFQEMFQLTNCKHPIIVLKDISKDDLEALLNYMYLGEVNVLQDRLTTLIKSAECLKIKGLAVPDDAPEKTPKNKREADHSDSRNESKRRCVETEHRKKSHNRDSMSKTHNENYSHSSMRGPSYSASTNEESPDSYSSTNILPDSLPTSPEISQIFKQEPIDEPLDSKESVRQMINLPFSSPNDEESTSNNVGDSGELDVNWDADDNMAYSNYDPGNEASNQSNMDAEVHFSVNQKLQRSTNHCPQCPYVARDKTNLRKHIFIHTGEKPFSCWLCPYKTTQNSNLRSHIRRLHLQEQDPSAPPSDKEQHPHPQQPPHRHHYGGHLSE